MLAGTVARLCAVRCSACFSPPTGFDAGQGTFAGPAYTETPGIAPQRGESARHVLLVDVTVVGDRSKYSPRYTSYVPQAVENAGETWHPRL